jgi:hypothetical protein
MRIGLLGSPGFHRGQHFTGAAATEFAARAFRSRGKSFDGFTSEAQSAVQGYGWPGNVRELLNVVERAALLWSGDGPVGPRELSVPGGSGGDAPRTRVQDGGAHTPGPDGYMELKKLWSDAFEKEYLVSALQRHGGNVSAAAREASDQADHLRVRRDKVAQKEDRAEIAERYDRDALMLSARVDNMRRVMALVWRTRGILLLRAHVAVTARRRPGLEDLPAGEIRSADLARAAEAVEHVTRFYRIYHSSRYVKDDLVIRLKSPLTAEQVDSLNSRFAMLVKEGKMALRGPFDVEEDHRDLPRLVFTHNRRNFGHVRRLIDAINDCTPAPTITK